MDPIVIQGKYTKAEIYAKTIEDGVYSQIYDIINCPAFKDKKVVLMPDVHVGASGPCGLCAEIGDWIPGPGEPDPAFNHGKVVPNYQQTGNPSGAWGYGPSTR